MSLPVEFLLFGLTLLGVAVLHRHVLTVALTGLALITLYKLVAGGFGVGSGLAGLGGHLLNEWVTLANLFGLLLGFALLSQHFEKSGVPDELPKLLPGNWHGPFLMLVMVFVLSSFLDNIAGALIGGAMAHAVFRGKVHIGFIAAIVAAANAGGAGSVVGDTTTTMMWIAGVSPLDVLHAYIAALVALFVFGIPAAIQQQRFSPLVHREDYTVPIDWMRIGIVAAILLAAIVTNVVVNLNAPQLAQRFPCIGLAVWIVLLGTVWLRRPAWRVLPESAKGAVFLLALVLCASMMPVERLPAASWHGSLALGFVSAVFDNIPLTALALRQGGYDWGVLAYAVGFGGSMIWFGSSAGVALSGLYPQSRSVTQWLRYGWHVPIAYVLGFFALYLTLGWRPG